MNRLATVAPDYNRPVQRMGNERVIETLEDAYLVLRGLGLDRFFVVYNEKGKHKFEKTVQGRIVYSMPGCVWDSPDVRRMAKDLFKLKDEYNESIK